jgi:predicted amidohydrolase
VLTGQAPMEMVFLLWESMVIHPKEEYKREIKTSEAPVKTVTLSREELRDFRKKFPVWKDRDEFEINA